VPEAVRHRHRAELYHITKYYYKEKLKGVRERLKMVAVTIFLYYYKGKFLAFVPIAEATVKNCER